MFREIHPVARERFCQGVLAKIAGASSTLVQNAHERYVKVFEVVMDKNEELAVVSIIRGGPTAQHQLYMIASADLLTDEERSRVSTETHGAITAAGWQG